MEGIDVELVEVFTAGDHPRQYLQTGDVTRKVSKAGALLVDIVIVVPERQQFA